MNNFDDSDLDIEELLALPSQNNPPPPSHADDDISTSSSSSTNNRNDDIYETATVDLYRQPDADLPTGGTRINVQFQPGELLTPLSRVTAPQRWKFWLVLAILLTIFCVVPLTMLLQSARTQFELHSECQECFAIAAKDNEKVIFNQTNGGTCSPFREQNPSLNQTYDLDTVVLDPIFCGAPQCQKPGIPGVLLVPDWASFCAALFCVFLSVFVNIIKYEVYYPLKASLLGTPNRVETNPLLLLGEYAEAMRLELFRKEYVANSPADQEALAKLEYFCQVIPLIKTVGFVDPYLYGVLLLYSVAHFLFIAYDVATNPIFADLSGWHKYQAVYGLFLNSGSLLVIWFWLTLLPFSKMKSTFNRQMCLSQIFAPDSDDNKPTWEGVTHQLIHEAEKVQRDLDIVLRTPMPNFLINKTFHFEICGTWRKIEVTFDKIVAVVITGPVFLTHIVPGLLLFIPYESAFTLGFVALVFYPMMIAKWALKKSSVINSVWALVVVRLVGVYFVVCVSSKVFSWTALFYGGTKWDTIMTEELILRNTDCYFNAVVNNIQVYRVGLAGLIFS